MKKKLYRNIEDKKIAGVCSGIADFMNVDVTIVRLICILLVFGTGTGLIAYIVAALVMPVK